MIEQDEEVFEPNKEEAFGRVETIIEQSPDEESSNEGEEDNRFGHL